MVYDVFISYSKKDVNTARRLARILEKKGLKVWWDKRLTPGIDYSKEIEHQLNTVNSVIVLWSENSIESRWVKDEALVAINRQVIIPVELDGAQSPIGFRQLQAAKLFTKNTNSETYKNQIIAILKALKVRLNQKKLNNSVVDVKKESSLKNEPSHNTEPSHKTEPPHTFGQLDTEDITPPDSILEIITNKPAKIYLRYIEDNKSTLIGNTLKTSLFEKYHLTHKVYPKQFEIIAKSKNKEIKKNISLTPNQHKKIIISFQTYIQYTVLISLILIGIITGISYYSFIFFQNKEQITDNMVYIASCSFFKGGEDDTNKPLLKLFRSKKDNLNFIKTCSDIQPNRTYIADYYMDINEVTNSEYRKFLSDRKKNKYNHPNQPEDKTDHIPEFWNHQKFNEGNQPVVGVDWFDAYAYCFWKGKKLQSFIQWQKAARGEDDRLFPWGNTFDKSRCNDNKSPHYNPVNVGSYPGGMSPYGVNDLVGNAEEWTDTKSSSSDNYYEIVGGSWNRKCEIFGLNFSRFISAEPSHKSKFLGFRCVSDNSHENMVKIPGGIFNSGGEKGFTLDILRKFSLLDKTIVQLISSQPEIVILNAYYIDKKEVSNSEYMEFLQIVKNKTKEIQQHFHPQAPSDKDYTPQYLYNQKYNKSDQPVIGVDWYDAYAYCSWKGKRLPTREEWENAAKGTHNNFYPWGNKYNEKYFQSDEKVAPDFRGLNNNDQSSYGVFDMASNVSEWTYDHSMNETQAIYGSSYKKGKLHEVYSVTFMHVIESKDYYSDETGFRCALTINEKN